MNDSDLNVIKDIVEKAVVFAFAKYGFPRPNLCIAHHKSPSPDDTEIWKDYWEEHHPSHHFPSEPHICPSCLMIQDDFVGGHLVIEDQTFIVPVCRVCNSTYKGEKADGHFFYVREQDMVRAPED